MGLFILLFQGSFAWDECLALYRCKDIVEKGFAVLKNDIDALPLNVRKDATVAGYLFVCFLALILRMRLLRLVKEAGLNKKYSIEGLLTELEKLRLMVLPDGTRIPTEVTKRQDILTALNLCANRVGMRIKERYIFPLSPCDDLRSRGNHTAGDRFSRRC